MFFKALFMKIFTIVLLIKLEITKCSKQRNEEVNIILSVTVIKMIFCVLA